MGMEGNMGSQSDQTREGEENLISDVDKARAMAEAVNEKRSEMVDRKKEHGLADNMWGDAERAARFEEELAAEKFDFQKKVENMGHRENAREVIRLKELLKIAEEGKKYWEDKGFYGI